MANPIKCKYCHVVTLEGFNEQERKYYEQGTKTMHTRERCTEAKNRGGAGLSQTLEQPQPQDQRTKDIKDAQEERRVQHRQLIKNLQWNTKMLAHVVEIQGGKQAREILDEMGFEEYQEEQRSFENNVV